MKKKKRTGFTSMLFLGIALILTGCGGGGGTTHDYTVGGTVSGLSGTLVLQNNGGDDLKITAEGSFTFSTAIADGSAYAVTVLTQPDGQTCTVSNGSGTISGADVTNVTVTCTIDTYTVGGTVSGLSSSGTVVLQNNSGDDLTITADGPFTFSTALADSSDYKVTVKTEPQGQSCFVTNGSGTVSEADVTNVTVGCYNSGSLDPTFNSGGTTPGIILSNGAAGGNDDGGNSITTDADGKILVTGGSHNSSGNVDMVIWRYNADGTLNTTFDKDGTTPGIVKSDNAAGGNGNDRGSSITTDADGKILVTGKSYNSSGNVDMVIWRYNADGTLDTTFNKGGTTPGIVVNDNAAGGSGDDWGNSITTDANGNILVTGGSYNGSDSYMVIWRYMADGTPDTTFGSNGIVAVKNTMYSNNTTEHGAPSSITMDANGKILVAGRYDYHMAIWRYMAEGTPDTTFGSNGIVVDYRIGHDWSHSITTDANGKILVTGSSWNYSFSDIVMVIWRYNADGTPDNTFDTDGIVVSNGATGGNGYDYGLSITTDANGKILVTGKSSYNGTDYDMVIWRYNTNGTPDNTFGTNGIVVSDNAASANDWGNSITTDANGKILVTGTSYDGTNYDMVIWRYIP